MTLAIVSAGWRRAFAGDWLGQINHNRTEKELIVEVGANEHFSVLSNKMFAEHQSGTWYFDGYAFLNENLVHPKLAAVSGAQISAIADSRADVSGVFVAGRLREDQQRFEVLTDQLGQYPLFICRSGRDFILSNDLNVIRCALHLSGQSPTPNPLAVAMTGVWGTAFCPETILREVKLLNAGESVNFSPNEGLAIVEAGVRQNYASPYSNYREALDDVKARLRARCAAVINDIEPGWNRLVDVSGGVDSRITLAGFLATGSAQDMTYHGLGGRTAHKSANRNVSDYLLRTFDLPLGVCVVDNSRLRQSLPLRSSQGIFRYFGLKHQGFTDFGELGIDNYCRVSGYFGECTKAHGSPLIRGTRPAKTAAETVENILGRVPMQALGVGQGGVAAIRSRMEEYYQDLMATVPAGMVNQFVYYEQKSRYHFGLNTAVANKFRVVIAPLLDPKIVSATSHLPYQKLKANRLAFDIIHGLGGAELAFAPFADYQWDIEKMKRGTADELPEAFSANSPALCEPLTDVRSFTIGTGPVERHEIELELNSDEFRRGIRKYQDSLSVFDQTLAVLVERIPRDDDLWQLLDREAFTPESLAKPISKDIKSKKMVIERRKGIFAMMLYYNESAYAPPRSDSVSGVYEDLQRDALDTAARNAGQTVP